MQRDENALVQATEGAPGGRALAVGGVTFDISSRPDYALLSVHLRQGEKLLVEPSAMATMDPTLDLKAGFRGGLGRTLGRFLGGESLIVNTFTAQRGPGTLTIAPATPGDLVHQRLGGGSLMLQRGAFVASTEGVQLTGKWQGARGFFSGEGLVLLRATGTGDLFFNSFGAILELDASMGLVVDTGYVVAFEDTVGYQVTALSGLRPGASLKSFLFGGEGFVCRFSGPGRVWIQTRDVRPFLRWVFPYRPVRRAD